MCSACDFPAVASAGDIEMAGGGKKELDSPTGLSLVIWIVLVPAVILLKLFIIVGPPWLDVTIIALALIVWLVGRNSKRNNR